MDLRRFDLLSRSSLAALLRAQLQVPLGSTLVDSLATRRAAAAQQVARLGTQLEAAIRQREELGPRVEMRLAADVIWRVPEEIDGHEVPQELRQRCEAVLL